MQPKELKCLTPGQINVKAEYSPSNAARALGVGLATIYAWIDRGYLKRMAGVNRFTGQTLLDALKKRDENAWQVSQRRKERMSKVHGANKVSTD